MGHAIEYPSYKTSMSKRDITIEINEYVSEESDSHGGLYNRIRWYDSPICKNYDEAQKFLEEHDNGNYDNLAVQYYASNNKDLSTSRKYQLLKARVDKITAEYNKMKADSLKGVTDKEFIVCKDCRSRINIQRWKYSTCPVCRTDFRAPTTLNYLKTKEQQLQKAKEALSTFEKEARYSPKNETYWMVKIEYHV